MENPLEVPLGNQRAYVRLLLFIYAQSGPDSVLWRVRCVSFFVFLIP